MHVPLCGADVDVAQKPAGELDSLFPADFAVAS
jgi:hypothetical protein